MESLENVINWIFGGQVDASKIITILVCIYAVVKSVTEWIAKKKLLKAETAETNTQKDLKQTKKELEELKECTSLLSDVVLTAYLSSNTIPEETKKKLGAIGEQLDHVAGIDLKETTHKLIDVATTVAPQLSLNEKKEEIDAAVEVVEDAIDAANDVAQSAIDKIRVS